MNPILFSSMTAQEEFRMTGTLSPNRIESLLSVEGRLEALDGLSNHIEEAMSQYPAEDFLSDIESRLHEFAKKLRGQNKEALLGIIESLSDLAQTTFYAADYGRSELKEALKAFKEGV
jgi:molecular chaperone DnaK (HSP70)